MPVAIYLYTCFSVEAFFSTITPNTSPISQLAVANPRYAWIWYVPAIGAVNVEPSQAPCVSISSVVNAIVVCVQVVKEVLLPLAITATVSVGAIADGPDSL